MYVYFAARARCFGQNSISRLGCFFQTRAFGHSKFQTAAIYTTITRFGFMNFVNFHEHPRDQAAGVSGAVHVAGLGGKDANQQHSDQSGQHA